MRWKDAELRGWGRVQTSKTQVARPEKDSALTATLAGTPCPAIGNLRSYGDAALVSDGHAVDTTRLDRIIAFDREAGTLTAEPGITISDLLRILAPHGWMPAVMPGTGFATLGGCIANDVHGKNHHGVGTFGQHVTHIELIQPKGGRVTTTPDGTPDLFKATVGGLGQTGVIAQATIRLVECTSQLIQVDERRAPDLKTFMQMLKDSQATYCVGWIDGTARGAALGRGVLEEAELTSSNMAPKLKKSRKVPFDAPSFALSPPTVRAFNQLYYRRVPDAGRGVLRALEDFFFPLDKIHDWNRLYGKRGFHQFQCVLPDRTAEPTLREMLTKISNEGLASPLAVLKRTGPGAAGHLSFPIEGFTLALDFPNSNASVALVESLNQMAADAGGRIYFAKDSTATAPMMAAMYPNLPKWQAEVAAADPDGALTTDLVRRLALRGA
ncbi:MAG: FAD-binding oxidoreductase [Pseudomonadota bacterium]